MPRALTPKTARKMQAARKTYGGPPQIKMRCGECGESLTMREWRQHPPVCPRRPEPISE